MNPQVNATTSPDYDAGYLAALEQHGLGPNATRHTLVAAPGYERLVAVYHAAHDQAARGKGKGRHANDLPFEQQRMLSICKLQGSPDGMVYQVMKKITEGLAMPELPRTLGELYGALNYLAGVVIFLEDEAGVPGPPLSADELATVEMRRKWPEQPDKVCPKVLLGADCDE